jgi:hypothetical protein
MEKTNASRQVISFIFSWASNQRNLCSAKGKIFQITAVALVPSVMIL